MRTSRELKKNPRLLVPAVLALMTAPILAQEPGPPFEEEIDVTEVTLDVRVTDDDGNAVLGLTPEDFSVTENGDPVEVVSVTSYSHRYVPDTETAPDSRFVMLLVHTPIGAEFERVGTLRRRVQLSRDLLDWLDNGMAPSDWVAVATYSSSLSLLQDFTQDREALRQALADAGQGKRKPSNPWPESDSPWDLEPRLPQGRELSRASGNIFAAMSLLGEASGHIIGRKLMVLFSPGFGDLGPDLNFTGPDRRRYRDLLATLSESNVVVFPIDTTPIEVDHTQQHALRRIANDTGGDFAPFVTRFDNRMKDITDHNSAYYLLSYSVGHRRADEGFRRVKVEVKDRDFEIVSRSGYVYTPEDSARR